VPRRGGHPAHAADGGEKARARQVQAPRVHLVNTVDDHGGPGFDSSGQNANSQRHLGACLFDLSQILCSAVAFL
jgi:hypothetical protein